MIFLFVTACTSHAAEPPDSQAVKQGEFAYRVPEGWLRHDQTTRTSSTAEWTPEDNPRKEALTVIRTGLDPRRPRMGLSTIQQLVVDAQRGLPAVHVGDVSHFTTRSGLDGVRVDTEFTPPGAAHPYHRVHSVIVDGATLVHVLYTASSPDPQALALEMVLDTIHEEG